MKKVFVSLSFMLAVGLTTAFADNHTDVNSKIKQSFKNEFAGAESVKWSKVEDYQMAEFIFHDNRLIAYYNEDGELMGSARDILFEQLPLPVIKSFDKYYTGNFLIEVCEISNTEGISYRITIEKQNKRYNIKINTDGNILKEIKIK